MRWFNSETFGYNQLNTFVARVKSVKVIAAFMSTQAITQIIALAVGLIVVRLLAVEQYAIYALFGALVGAGAVGTNLGSSGIYLTQASRSNEKDEHLILAGLTARMRSGLLLITVPILTGIFLWVTPQIWWHSILTVCFLAVVIFFQASAALNRARLSFDHKLGIINRAEPYAALVRLLLLGGALITVGYSNVFFAIAVWTLSAGILAVWLKRNVAPVQRWPPTFPDGEMKRIMLPLLPGHLYYIVTGLLPVLSLGSLGATANIAEFWALGRLAAVFAIIDPMLHLIAHPFVSRGHDEGFAKRSISIVAFILVLVVLLVALGWLYPKFWLLALGGTYFHLGPYVWLALLAPGMYLLSNVFYTMAVASGETSWQYLTVPVGIVAQIVVLWLSPIVDIDSAYRFALITAGVQLFVQFILYLRTLLIIVLRSKGKVF